MVAALAGWAVWADAPPAKLKLGVSILNAVFSHHTHDHPAHLCIVVYKRFCVWSLSLLAASRNGNNFLELAAFLSGTGFIKVAAAAAGELDFLVP